MYHGFTIYMMATGNTKTKDSTTVRIWTEPKERLQNVVREKAAKERRDVTELELASRAIEEFCEKEERMLGMKKRKLGIA